MSNRAVKGQSIVQSVSRALEILEIVARAGMPIGITEIAEATKLPMPTIHRLLHTLIASGYVYQTPRRRYALGTRLISLSRYAGGALGVALRPLLTKTVEELGESVSVAMLDQDFARYIAHVPSERSMRMFTEVGNQVSLHATGVGKAILAAMPPSQAGKTIDRCELRALTPRTITDPEALRDHIDLVRERGYAIDDNEHEVGVCCVAVSVPGDLYLAVSVAAPVGRIDLDTVETHVVPVLQETANSIAQLLAEERRAAEEERQAAGIE
ncbi:MAG: IclR family transcriptional regulator [Actinomycetaceae bacterium]|nr:IclR family transcriptional regulator [Actinomycetaceae bacterium]